MTLQMALPRAEVGNRADATVRMERLRRMFKDDYRLVWRVVRRIGLPVEAANDAAQQVFMIAAERLDDIRLGSERAFLFGTALRVARSIRRKLGREIPSGAGYHIPSPSPRPDELTDQKRARQLLDAALGELPLELRMVFVLFELEGMTTPEISETVGIPLGTAASRLRRARKAFREQVLALTGAKATVRGTP